MADRQPYLGQQTAAAGRTPYLGGSAAATKKSGGGGLLGTLSRIPGAFASDLENAAMQSPGALYQLGKASVLTEKQLLLHPGKKGTPLTPIGKAYAAKLKAVVKHPLRHPGDTTLFALPALGTVARVGVAGTTAARLAKAGDTAGAAKALIKRPDLGSRVLKVGGAEAHGHYSRATGSALAQRAVDTGLQKAATRSIRAENVLHRRAAKWNERTLRVQEAKDRSAGTRLQAAGAKLTPAEQRALRLVAEETPVARRLGAQHMRAARAEHPKEVARHQERIGITTEAMKFLDDGPGGKPVFKPTATKLARIYDLLKTASGDREGILKNLDLMDEAAAQASKTKVARIAAGGKYVKSAGIIGAEDIAASPKAVFVGNPAERTKLLGRPKVSPTGTVGHTHKPSSLKTATGGSVEHALERNDTTAIVAERHAEAVRLNEISRRVDLVKRAGEKSPRRNDDVWVWTDKTVSNERIPTEVRKYLDNPDGIAKLPEGQQHTIMDQIRDAVMQRHDWQADPDALAEFEKLAEQGKGVFVPRRFLGNAAKRDPNIAAVPGVHFLDAVNNAQKAGLIYLKLNYPVVQGLSNTAMSIIHQGFAAPVRLTQAVRLEHSVGPEYAAMTDDVMGGGAVLQAAFHGQGAISHISQNLARIMSSKVDTPARRAAFIDEAAKAGFNTPEKYRALFDDDANTPALVEIAQRAKEAIVDYSELSPVERSLVRRLVFVYPWQKGATKYAGHFVRDHPVQAAALGMLGQQGAETSDSLLGPVPSYLKGVFDVGGGLVNPAGVNFFQTPAQIGRATAGLATGNPAAATGLDFLAPFPAVSAALLGRRDSLGRPLKGSLPAKLRHLLVEPTPIAGLARATGADRSALVRDVVGGKTTSQTFPNPNDAFWRFLLGGLYPRQYSKPALNKNAALEKTGR